MSCCELENKYMVYAADSDGNMIKNLPLLKCREKSGICTRTCIPADCRPFTMNVEHEAKGASSTDGEVCLSFKRDF
jgi:hypothetical protein